MSTHVVEYEEVKVRRVKKTITIELQYCPFCGGEAEFRRANTHWKTGGGWGVRCKDCKVVGPIKQGFDAQLRVAEAWNRRVEI